VIIDKPFPLQVVGTLAALGVLSAYPIIRFGNPETVVAIGAGGLLATINVLAGFAAIEFSIGKPATVFMRYVLGGMGIRMLVMALTLVVLLKIFTFDPLALVGSLGICYVVFLVLEIMYIQRKV
jgi:hypothetical protein